jgi:hypothetical protein
MRLSINGFVVKIDQRRVSKLIRYPDGVDRILTLTGSEWASIDIAADNGYHFDQVLWAAIELSKSRQGDSLPGKDINSCTWFMLRTILGRIQEQRAPVSNENDPRKTLETKVDSSE